MSFVLLGILNSQAAGGVQATPAYDLISTTVLSSDTDNVRFINLDNLTDYDHLQIRGTFRGNDPSASFLALRFNSNSGTNYSTQQLYGQQTSAQSQNLSPSTETRLGRIPGNDFDTGNYASAVIDITDFADASKNTTMRALHGFVNIATTDTYIAQTTGTLFNTGALTRIDIGLFYGSLLKAGSRISLYGLKGA